MKGQRTTQADQLYSLRIFFSAAFEEVWVRTILVFLPAESRAVLTIL